MRMCREEIEWKKTNVGILKFSLKQKTLVRGSGEKLQSLGFIPQSLVLMS